MSEPTAAHKHPETTNASEHPRCGDAGRLPRFPCTRTAGHDGPHLDALSVEWGNTCGAHKPSGDSHLMCALPAGHEGVHRDAQYEAWTGPWARTCGELPDVPAGMWRYGPCCRPVGHDGEHVNSACHTWEEAQQAEPAEQAQQPRRLGIDAASGKTAYAVTEPGGMLDRRADAFALESATIWCALASEMIDAPLDAEEVQFVLARVVEALGEVLPIAAKVAVNNPAVDLPLWGQSARDIGAALKHMRD